MKVEKRGQSTYLDSDETGSRQVTSLVSPSLTADFLAPFFALLLESPAVCYAIRYGKARPPLSPALRPLP